MEEEARYPIGIQTFRDIVVEGWTYVDKTGYVYKLARNFRFVFLSRPRRFGKSLLTSTLKSYFEGRKDLFEGLAAGKLEKEWIKYPVLTFDMSTAKHASPKDLESELNFKLLEYEETFGRGEGEENLNQRLQGIIKRAYKQSGQKVVVLIDEYDAPLLDVVHEKENLESLRQIMRNFYSPLKACDSYIRFAFITGITKFSQLSIFSELNNLMNISLMPEYSAICGITKTELHTQLRPNVETMARALRLSTEDMYEKLRINYDGYHFSKDSEDLFNPFSIIKALAAKSLDYFWFESGTPTYLIKLLQHFRTDITKLQDYVTSAAGFDTPTENMKSIYPLLYQSGHLTIQKFDLESQLYTLGLPNAEVRTGLYDALFPYYIEGYPAEEKDCVIAKLFEDVRDGHILDMLEDLKIFYATIPNDLENKSEKHYQTIFYIIITLMGRYIQTEVKSAIGRADAVMKTKTHIYVIEMKVDKPADEALAQIDEKGYLIPFAHDGRKVVKVGICFDSTKRTLGGWKIQEE